MEYQVKIRNVRTFLEARRNTDPHTDRQNTEFDLYKFFFSADEGQESKPPSPEKFLESYTKRNKRVFSAIFRSTTTT